MTGNTSPLLCLFDKKDLRIVNERNLYFACCSCGYLKRVEGVLG